MWRSGSTEGACGAGAADWKTLMPSIERTSSPYGSFSAGTMSSSQTSPLRRPSLEKKTTQEQSDAKLVAGSLTAAGAKQRAASAD
mmetsp:Transcript_727/g.1585  ORF Transcript_727/g.1585 Transcript_727/m.1585 type:complete len:85 (+) Transcript_727:324-578(+)